LVSNEEAAASLSAADGAKSDLYFLANLLFEFLEFFLENLLLA